MPHQFIFLFSDFILKKMDWATEKKIVLTNLIGQLKLKYILKQSKWFPKNRIKMLQRCRFQSTSETKVEEILVKKLSSP